MGMFEKPQQSRPRWFFRGAEGHRDHSQRSQEATSRVKKHRRQNSLPRVPLQEWGLGGGSLDFVIFSLVLARYWEVVLFKEK